MNYQEIGFIPINPIVNKLPAGIWTCLIICQLFKCVSAYLIMVFPSFVVKKLESIFIFVTMNLVFFSSVTRSCGEDILSILVRNNKKCLSKLLFISLLIFRRLRSLPVARGVPRNSALVGEERAETPVYEQANKKQFWQAFLLFLSNILN